MRRATINDIARYAGVSKGAVSFALNGRPGVSTKTRERILSAARDLGWQPSSAARALSASRSDMLGLVLTRDPALIGAEPYFMQLIAGIQAELGPSEVALTLQVIGDDPERECELYRRWAGTRRVDGVFLVDLHEDDPRIALCDELDMPAVVLGRRRWETALPCLSVDADVAMETALAHLAALGHSRIGRVAGVPGYVQTLDRGKAFRRTVRRLGLSSAGTVTTDYSKQQGDAATRKLLSLVAPPTAILYDNDVMAVSAVGLIQSMGLTVPRDMSIIAWDDSGLCELPYPPVTAMRADVVRFGTVAAQMLRRLVDGDEVEDVDFPPPELVVRATTARPRTRARGPLSSRP